MGSLQMASCAGLKEQYDRCFNHWYRHHFLQVCFFHDFECISVSSCFGFNHSSVHLSFRSCPFACWLSRILFVHFVHLFLRFVSTSPSLLLCRTLTVSSFHRKLVSSLACSFLVLCRFFITHPGYLFSCASAHISVFVRFLPLTGFPR